MCLRAIASVTINLAWSDNWLEQAGFFARNIWFIISTAIALQVFICFSGLFIWSNMQKICKRKELFKIEACAIAKWTMEAKSTVSGSNLFSEITFLLRTKNLTGTLPIQYFKRTSRWQFFLWNGPSLSWNCFFFHCVFYLGYGPTLIWISFTLHCDIQGVCWKWCVLEVVVFQNTLLPNPEVLLRSTTWATRLKALRRPFDLTYVEYDLTEYDVWWIDNSSLTTTR